MKYVVVYERGPTSWGASVPDLPGCFAVAETREEVERLISDAVADHIEVLREYNEPVPQPGTWTGVVEVEPQSVGGA